MSKKQRTIAEKSMVGIRSVNPDVPLNLLTLSQVMKMGEETGEALGAYLRYVGISRRPGTFEEFMDELADVVISAYVAAAFLGADLDEAIDRKSQKVLTRGWREEKPVDEAESANVASTVGSYARQDVSWNNSSQAASGFGHQFSIPSPDNLHAIPSDNFDLFMQDYWWLSKAYGFIPIADMKLTHLDNCIGMFEERPAKFIKMVADDIARRVRNDDNRPSVTELLYLSLQIAHMKIAGFDWIRATPLYKKMVDTMAERHGS